MNNENLEKSKLVNYKLFKNKINSIYSRVRFLSFKLNEEKELTKIDLIKNNI